MLIKTKQCNERGTKDKGIHRGQRSRDLAMEPSLFMDVDMDPLLVLGLVLAEYFLRTVTHLSQKINDAVHKKF